MSADRSVTTGSSSASQPWSALALRTARFGWWTIRFDGALLTVLTPWFAAMVSDGGRDFITDSFWWGVKLWWKPNRRRTPGDCRFSKRKEWVFRHVTRERLMSTGPNAFPEALAERPMDWTACR